MRGFLYLGLLASSLLTCTCTAADIKRYSGLEKRDGQKEWIIRPKNGKDTTKLKDTEANIKKIAAVDHVYSYTDFNKNLRHWLVAVTDSQLDSIKADDGVGKVAENRNFWVKEAAVSMPSPPDVVSAQASRKVKRDTKYTRQKKPKASELITVSQPSDKPILSLTDYFYEKKGGSGIYIYHVEVGVALFNKAEFLPKQVEILQGPLSKERGQKEDEELANNDSHSTCAASKAVGQLYGTAKGATLVVVKLAGYDIAEASEAFDVIRKDLEAHPERKGNSIVTMSISSGDPVDPNDLDVDLDFQKDDMEALVKDNIIIVVPAGNHAIGNKDEDGKALPNRPNIDTFPAVVESATLPLIVIGATNNVGKEEKYSQHGPHLTIGAPGYNVRCQGQDPAKTDPFQDSGTSFAAPLVAGVLATLLADADKPIKPENDEKLAFAAKRYLKDKANWTRNDNYKSIWNGVTSGDIQKVIDEDGAAGTGSVTPTVAPVDPPAQRSCLPNPTDSVKDAHEAKMQAAANHFCDAYGKETAAKEAPNVHHRVWGTDSHAVHGGGFPIGQDYKSEDKNDDVYDVGIKGVDGCVPQGGYNLAEPLKDVKCSDMVSKAWRECGNNQGRGGDYTAGCLIYSAHTVY